MIQIAVRTLTLNVYNASDDMVSTFITTPPASEYFSDLVLNLREQCLHLDSLVSTTMDTCTYEMRNQLRMKTDQVVNDLYYFNDILRIGQPRLSRLMVENLLRSLVLPVLVPLLQLNQNVGSHVSSITSLYVICRLLQVVDGRELINSVALALLYFYTLSFVRSNSDKDAIDGGEAVNYIAQHLIEFEDVAIPALEPEGAENINKTNLFRLLTEYISSTAHFASCLIDNVPIERSGILSLILSENHSILLASLMFLLILSESKDLDSSLSTALGFAEKKTGMEQGMFSDNLLSRAMDGNIFARHMPQILNALLKVLVGQPPLSGLTQWHTGWVLGKLLRYHETKLTDHDIDLFSISFKRSTEGLLQELNGCWFDYIPVTLEHEREKCKRALDESSQLKDPFVSLEISMHKPLPDGVMSSLRAWQRMVDAVKVFVLHYLLEAFISKRDSQEDPLQQLKSASMGTLIKDDGIDVHSVTYGTQMGLGPGLSCKIAFSKGEVRDVYLIPVAKGISGKLLLAEKLPLHTHRGVVIAIAPLAGLSPKKDDNQSTWLHLRIREFDPRVDGRKAGGYDSTGSDHVVDGRWTLAFPTPDICEAALSLILRETEKQRSSVERLLAPLLQKYSPNNLPDCQGA
ncbi:hypothetical protein BVC80_1289g38 [Macleaya cordata]|uniref:FPL domain-containing protein n=1 Tax=Macleaya cordata TaxID=56857 RepID=A0A200Q9K3_MACCD|nr:hypothetical protein BVC80_1289g38 [Macleaya cordata]